jgi:HK97 family phage portal protein
VGIVLEAAGRALGLLAAEPIDGTWGAVGTYDANVQPPSRATAGPVTVTRALGLPAYYRAVELAAGVCASLDLASFRGSQLTPRQPALVQQPDPWRELDSWIERQVINYATEGNNFLRIYRDAQDQVMSLEVLNPFTTAVLWQKVNGRYRKSYSVLSRDGRIELPASDVIHSFGLEVAGLDRGLSPIAWTRAALEGVLNVRDYADRWFADEAVDGLLTTDQRLDAESIPFYKQAWYDQQADAARAAGPSVRVLGSGLKYEPMMLKPADAQWLEAQNFGILDIARISGTPAALLEAAVEGTALTYQTLETIHAQYLRTTLFPRYLRKIESAVTRALPRGQRGRFLTDELLRPDAKTRAEIDAAYITARVYDGQYVRDRDGIAIDRPIESPAPASGVPAPAAAGTGD